MVEREDGRSPECKSIDIMQANPYGFNTAVNNYENAMSRCEYNMSVEGKEKYGSDAYGPGGSLIDTYRAFTVFTEFLSH